ncbi:right-handed parallel beta-helix repeat-containing protein [Puniceicoccaceae bacterium K14]|nr:right-handed parallel beta-helix repeat-containing protein [Puniceicoccaceae bacterium K14]
MKTCYAFLIAFFILYTAQTAEYYADPTVEDGGQGTRESPWPSLQKSIAEGNLSKLKPSDTLYLKDGYHGSATISGINEDFITITSAPDQQATLSRLTLTKAARWNITNLRISPTFGGQPYKGDIVTLTNKHPESGKNILENCEIFAEDSHLDFEFEDWINVNKGVLIGQYGTGTIVRNCYIRNTRFALTMTAFDCLAEGNVIEHYSGDGIRMTRDGQTAQYNIIKKAFAPTWKGDKNHDDAIQCFLHEKGSGTMRNLTISHNIIIGHDPKAEPFAAINQGIGLFDGPLVNFTIEGNVVMVNHWHGISVYDGQDCTIASNVVWSKFKGKMQPSIRLGQKLNKARDNIVTGNFSPSYGIAQPGTKSRKNKYSTRKVYRMSLQNLLAEHNALFGFYHPIANRERILEDL